LDYVIGNPVYGNLGDATSLAGFVSAGSPAPEPTSAALLMLGAACFAGLRKRK